jgi:hypothetical protein
MGENSQNCFNLHGYREITLWHKAFEDFVVVGEWAGEGIEF